MFQRTRRGLEGTQEKGEPTDDAAEKLEIQ